jgi:CRP-like cAMP-binding protein
MKVKTYKPGDIIIQEGDTDRDLYVLNAGVVEVSMREENSTFVLNEIESPQIIGELSFLTGYPRTATARAKTDVEVFIFSYENLEGQISQLPTSIRPIINTLISRVKKQDQRIVKLEEELLALKGRSQAA